MKNVVYLIKNTVLLQIVHLKKSHTFILAPNMGQIPEKENQRIRKMLTTRSRRGVPCCCKDNREEKKIEELQTIGTSEIKEKDTEKKGMTSEAIIIRFCFKIKYKLQVIPGHILRKKVHINTCRDTGC